ncbi:hypothetical protein FOD75_11515 (plasmid) [Limosilactobacillus reuteri]|uniref:Uncharacterized protein n=1 Tax=Limosilactobacillus reuteri TaxID=1598 RepID=A0A517D8N6_LIMRT|nr:hypothetical protein [Limosilactobacillus reuteri]QDR73709.1 hypothetical protein FOD75_11515 [Limosilactobacillus reuteri]
MLRIKRDFIKLAVKWGALLLVGGIFLGIVMFFLNLFFSSSKVAEVVNPTIQAEASLFEIGQGNTFF